LKNIINSEVETPEGKARIQEFYITELGHLMVKLFYKKSSSYRNYRIGSIEDLMLGQDIKLKESWSEKIELV